MNKMSIWFMCIAILLTINMASAGQIDKIYITNTTGDTGNNVVVSVNATNMKDIGSLQLDVQYDKNILAAENVTGGDLGSGGMFTSKINDTGKVTIGLISTEGISGNGSIADIVFRVIGPKGTSSPLNIIMTVPTDPKNIPIDVQDVVNATFTLSNAGTIGTVSPTVTISPTTTVSPTITKMVPNPDNGSGGDTGVRDSSRNGDASNGGSSSGGSSNISGGETSTYTKTPIATTVPTTLVSKETAVPERTADSDKNIESEKTQDSPGLGIFVSITILSTVYMLRRKKG